MTVLARNRTMASTEYVMQMVKLHKHTAERMGPVPNRLKKFIVPKIMKPMTLAHYDVITGYGIWQNHNSDDDYRKYLDDAVRVLMKLQRPLLIYWVLRNTSESGAAEWAGMINRDIALLYGATGKREAVIPMIHTYQLKYAPNRIFVWNMEQILRHFYSKLSQVPLMYKDHLTDEILHILDNAMYHVVEGNRVIPKTEAQYKYRRKNLQRAIADLNSLQIPLLSLWTVMQYSEREYDEQAAMISEEIKLLRGVVKADRERYQDLS